MKSPSKQARAHFDLENQRCAKIIVAGPERHPGLQLEWARAVLAKRTVTQTVARGQQNLFGEAA